MQYQNNMHATEKKSRTTAKTLITKLYALVHHYTASAALEN